MATKTIYLEKETESILNKYVTENGLTLSKTINIIIQGKESTEVKKPVKQKETEQKKPASNSGQSWAEIIQAKRKKKA